MIHKHPHTVRMTIHLTEAQVVALRERARQQSVSVSELVRYAVDVVLMVIDPEIRRRASEAVGFVSSGDKDVSVRHDDYLAEAYRH